MARHWQRSPLLARGAIPDFRPPISRSALFALAARDEVESRLVRRTGRDRWLLAHGPFARGELPSLEESDWTLLVQGVDLHRDPVHALLREFRFVPDARLDDLMISWASDGGGVGPHVDNYDVFLLQARGRRRWRIARRFEPALDARAPLKVLRRFVAEEEYLLEPGDLLYLPPHWAHEGVAIGGDCMTFSIGMRAPERGALGAELLQRLAENAGGDAELYRDRGQAATRNPASIPPRLLGFARDAVEQLAARPASIARALGEVMSEPKPGVWFTKRSKPWRPGFVELDRRTRMLYDERQVFINGEAVAVGGRDAALLRALADNRSLDAKRVRGASRNVRQLLAAWFAAGWLR